MPPTLDYAKRPPWYKRAITRRRALLFFFLLLIVFLAIFYIPTLIDDGLRLYWQRRCMNHSFPAGTLALEMPGNLGPKGKPPEFQKFDSSIIGDEDIDHPVFLHRLASSAGDRLVYIYISQNSHYLPDTDQPELNCIVYIPATFGDKLSLTTPYRVFRCFGSLPPATSIRIYTGESDP